MSQHTRQGTTPQTIPSGGAPAPERTGAPDGRRLGLTLGMLVLPMYVALGAPSVALPAIGRALAVPFGATAWILAAWSLTSALTMPVAGRLLVRWSPFQVLVAGVVALAAGSVLAGAGPTLSVVIVGRLIGGAGAGATVIAVFAAATALPGRQRIRALGIIAAASATASGCGTLLGGAVTAWLGWRAVLAIPALALPLLLAALPSRRALTRSGSGSGSGSGERNGSTGRLDIVGAAVLSVLAGSLITLLQAHSVGLPAPVTLVVAAAGALAAVGLWWRVRSTPDGFVPRRVIASRGFLAAGLIGGTVFAGYYGVLFRAPSLIEQATGGGPLEAGVLLVPAAACSVLAGRLVGTLTDRFTGWQVSAGLAALTVVGVLVVALFTGPIPIVLGMALTVCGFAGAQAVLVSLAPDLVAADDRDTAQSLLNFMNALGGGIGPAAVAGLSGIVPVPVALAALAALPLAGLVLSLTRRPTAGRRPEPDAPRGSPR
ncbi:MFS transporter [Streptomyces hygroscopicus]|uniref:MFS transporter n=1 Tax=Streptomyces hygroscopicus TaxID=1912 RepID=UPI00082DB8CF|nr:MFS transporter [Streptomyces hygroscopicus]GLV72644.1 MFS transporter [Streptomyces hygroscopicus subsp. hygroscopicus]